MSASTQASPSPQDGMFQLLMGKWVCCTVSCVARLGLPDLVKDGPKTAAELSAATGARADTLYRLMRAAASVGVLSEGPDGKFSQTPMSETLTSDAKPSLRQFAILLTQEWQMRGWELIDYCLRTGEQAPEKLYGMPGFEYLQKNPEAGETFNQAMTSLSGMDGPAVVGAYDFAGIGSIVDVGGGHGLLLATILERHPGIKGTLYDLAYAVEGAKTGPLAPMMGRCTLIAGDMFESVPPGADAYIMKYIIHDWEDELCRKILTGCRKGVKPGGRLLVVDQVIPPGNEFSAGKFMDLEMLVFPGGQERTEKEFGELFASAGWRLNRIIPTAAAVSIVEGVAA